MEELLIEIFYDTSLIFFKEQQKITLIVYMLPYRNNNYNNPPPKRKTKEGDWVCMRCSNYNYAFRSLCNRCRAQTKEQNNTTINMICNQNYGQNLFPSVLFLKLDPYKTNKDNNFPAAKQNCEHRHQIVQKVQRSERVDEGKMLRQNNWIHNLINQ